MIGQFIIYYLKGNNRSPYKEDNQISISVLELLLNLDFIICN